MFLYSCDSIKHIKFTIKYDKRTCALSEVYNIYNEIKLHDNNKCL